jgi:FlaA1/EpsC-like NDP-sugar epimerase
LKAEVDMRILRVAFTIRIATTFIMLILMRVYQTSWTRAATSNYVRLFFSCALGSIISSAIIYYIPDFDERYLTEVTVLFAVTGFIGLMGIRFFRAIVRDIFYAIDCSRLRGRKDVSRILVYGAGLRYKAFRRELVRTTAANDRMIVGLVDDNILLRGKYIGGIKIYGTINEIAEIINITNADSLVIACKVSDEWRTVLKKLLAPTGVKVTEFVLEEVEFV